MVRRNLKIIIICLVILAGLGAAFVVTRPSEGNRSPAADNQPTQSAPASTKTETSTVDKITINNIDYQIHFTNNQTAQALKDLFPLEITMEDFMVTAKSNKIILCVPRSLTLLSCFFFLSLFIS